MTNVCKAHTLRISQSSRGRGTGFAGPQAQRPPRGAESHTQWANVGAMS
jgi:hypothetical protein